MSKTFGTMGTMGSKTFGDPNSGLANLGELLAVLEELQIKENSEQWNTLLDSRRSVVAQMNAEIKLQDVNVEAKACRLYFFNDMFIIGQYRQRKKKKNYGTLQTLKTSGTTDDVIFGELTGRKSSETDSVDFGSKDDLDSELNLETMRSSAVGKSRRSKKSKTFNRKSRKASQASVQTTGSETPALRVKLWMDLENVDARKMVENNEPGIRCFCTIQETVEDEETGEISYNTDIQQVQFFFTEAERRDEAYKYLTGIVDSLLEAKIKGGSKFGDDLSMADGLTDAGSVQADDNNSEMGEEDDKVRKMMSTMRLKTGQNAATASFTEVSRSISTTSGTTNQSKKRSYAKGKETMRKLKYNRNQKKSGNGGQTFDALTLDDLVDRYKVVLSPEDSNQAAKFNVTFGPGPMGFALSSMKGSDVGVFVGKLESGGMAEVGGVTLGDRILKVADVNVSQGMSWMDCIGVIKVKRGELDENGKPKKLVLQFARAKEVEENVTQKLEEQKKQMIKERIKRRGGKREWTKRKQKSFGSRMASLNDIANRYTSNQREQNESDQEKCDAVFEKLIADAKSKAEKKCAHILKEMFDTERSYLSSLYTLVDNYLKVLSKKKVPIPCNEVRGQGVSKFCEHSLPRQNCKEMSSTKKPLISPKEAKALFGNVELLVKINESLMENLQKRIVKLRDSEPAEITIVDIVLIYAPVFSKIMPFFRIYSHYAFQYSNALETLNILKENEVFKEELNRIESKKKNEALTGLLIKPIARLCKYPLLFATLNDAVQSYISEVATEAKETGEGDMEKLDKCFTELLDASQIVASIAESVDVKVGTSHDLEKLYEIYQELGGHKAVEQFMVPSRRFIGKYEILIEDKSSRAKIKVSKLYLFNDLVIFAEDKSGKFFGAFENRTGSYIKLKKGTMDSQTTLSRSEVKSKSSRSKTSRLSAKRSSTKRKTDLVVKRKMKIDTIKVRKKVVPNKDGLHGFSFTETERKTSIVKKSRKEKEEIQESKLYNFEIWCVDEAERDQILDKINEQIKSHRENLRARKKINQKLKPELAKKQRQWRNKARQIRHKSMQALGDEEEEKKKENKEGSKSVTFN